MYGNEKYRISIEVLENGYNVEVPDMEMYAKKEAAAKKSKDGPSVYYGDCQKEFIAQTLDEALKIVRKAMNAIPDKFSDAFSEATKEKK